MLSNTRLSAEARRFPQSASAGACPSPHQTSNPDVCAPEALRVLLDAPDVVARDAAWSAFVAVLEHLCHDDFRRLRGFAPDGTERFTTWLVVGARRLLQDHRRAQYGWTGRSSQSDIAEHAPATMRRNLVGMVGEEICQATMADGTVAAPDVLTQTAERAEAVRLAISSLDPRDQLLLKLRYDSELPADRIAAVAGCPTHFHVYRRLRAVLRLLSCRLHPAYADAP